MKQLAGTRLSCCKTMLIWQKKVVVIHIRGNAVLYEGLHHFHDWKNVTNWSIMTKNPLNKKLYLTLGDMVI